MYEIKLSGSVEFRSACDGGSCVETAMVILVRDSKDPDGPVQVYTLDEWHAHIEAAKAGKLDVPAEWPAAG
ncbi:DUF397 domain-containing protein [Nonomuraea sp. NPDC049419]|uniref:DUF397 domain-containing protein n=1 Tax=Nonomuraea sp. NPDC049419 TaxID=3155772 RepID=UPI0034398601